MSKEKALVIESMGTAINVFGSALLGPLWEAKNLIKTLYSEVKKSAYNDFLIGIYYKFKKEGLKEKDIVKFTKKLEKKEYHEYIGNILDSMFFSKNQTARFILGWIAMKYLVEDNLDYEDLIIINTLKDIYDEEISIFKKFYDFNTITQDYTQKEYIVMNKFINNNLFGRVSEAGMFAPDNHIPYLRYEKTSISNRLYDYVLIAEKI